MIEKYTEYLIGKRLADISIRNYLRYYKLFEKGLETEDLTQSYINQFLIKHTSNSGRAFIKHILELFELERKFKVPKLTGSKKYKEKKSLTDKDIEVLSRWLETNRDIKYVLCLELSYNCALRRSEVLKIKMSDFDLGVWSDDPEKSCKLLIHGKRRQERYVPVPSKVMFKIIDYVQEKGLGMDDNLFGFSYVLWHEAFKDAVKETMDYNFTLHDLRRSKATQWLREGVDLTRVRNRLGHASVETTQLYINLDREKEFDSWANE